jgi:uncharacterized protein (TIGR03000 family)
MAASMGGGGSGGGMGASAGGGGARSQGAGSASGDVTQSLRELQRSIEDVRKEQDKTRIDMLKLTADELKRKATEEKIDELRRNVDELRRRLPPPAIVPPGKVKPELPPPQPGKVLLDMPADALVFINNKQIDVASVFLTPPLDPSQEYVVNVEAALVRDGKSINRVKRLSLHAGAVVRLAYNNMESGDGRWTRSGEVTASPAHITVRLPADARLSVQGVDCPLTSDTRAFDTPELAPGQKYYYLLKAEVVRDGRAIAQTRRVDFRSGERVTVSFADLGATRVSAR